MFQKCWELQESYRAYEKLALPVLLLEIDSLI